LHACSYWTAFWVFAGGNLALLLLASSITAFVSPAAGGSGIPEVKAYLNGVDAPNIFSLRTLAVKVRRRRACSYSYPILPGLAVAFLLPAHGPLTAASSAVHLDCSH
jgi:chloride channel 7